MVWWLENKSNFFRNIWICAYIYTVWKTSIASAQYLFFFGFILALNPLCGPSLAPCSYKTQKRLASDERESVHLSGGHCYQVATLNYVNFSSEVTFQLTSGGKPKQAHFLLCCVLAVTSLTQKEVRFHCGWNSERKCWRSEKSWFLLCRLLLATSGRVRCLTGAGSGLLKRNISP